MADVVIIGAGFSGHTAALYLVEKLNDSDNLTVISNSENFIFRPLLADVATGRLKQEKITISLPNIYSKFPKINFINAKVTAVFPDENVIEITKEGTNENKIKYDFLIIATGSTADFSATKGFVTNRQNIGSIVDIAEIKKTQKAVDEIILQLKKGDKKKIIVGSGHPNSTYHNGTLNFAINLHYRLIDEKVRDRAEILYFTNENQLGDFGLRNPVIKRNGKLISAKDVLIKILNEHNIKFSTGNAVKEINSNQIFYENSDGEFFEENFDLAVLIPKIKGTEIKFIDKNGTNITSKIFDKDNRILVDTFYNLEYSDLISNPDLLPSRYWNRNYKNIFAGGSVFAMPSTISEPVVTKNGTNITPEPFIGTSVSAAIGRLIAKNISEFMTESRMTHSLRLSELLSIFTIQLGGRGLKSEAFFLSIYPVFPDVRKYPKEHGRDLFVSSLEVGTAAHWMRKLINESYIYKFKAKTGWRIIPE